MPKGSGTNDMKYEELCEDCKKKVDSNKGRMVSVKKFCDNCRDKYKALYKDPLKVNLKIKSNVSASEFKELVKHKASRAIDRIEKIIKLYEKHLKTATVKYDKAEEMLKHKEGKLKFYHAEIKRGENGIVSYRQIIKDLSKKEKDTEK